MRLQAEAGEREPQSDTGREFAEAADLVRIDDGVAERAADEREREHAWLSARGVGFEHRSVES
ncbi:MAG: hypothetical protein EPO40_01650 [Myxococcaceae bacterium]|nr:MAG: hypothetical protein EPO40_01650 [Myxococcaceae bacterium]